MPSCTLFGCFYILLRGYRLCPFYRDGCGRPKSQNGSGRYPVFCMPLRKIILINQLEEGCQPELNNKMAKQIRKKRIVNPSVLTEPLEAYTRQIIETRLTLLGYDTEESHHETCNVYRERAKTVFQPKSNVIIVLLLSGLNPRIKNTVDYVALNISLINLLLFVNKYLIHCPAFAIFFKILA